MSSSSCPLGLVLWGWGCKRGRAAMDRSNPCSSLPAPRYRQRQDGHGNDTREAKQADTARVQGIDSLHNEYRPFRPEHGRGRFKMGTSLPVKPTSETSDDTTIACTKAPTALRWGVWSMIAPLNGHEDGGGDAHAGRSLRQQRCGLEFGCA